MCVYAYVCMWVYEICSFVFITIHAQYVIKKCSIKILTKYTANTICKFKYLTQEITGNSNPISLKFKITFKRWLK
jgi:hypothetical protein